MTITVDTSITAIVMNLTLYRIASNPTTVPPVAPPTFNQLNTWPAELGAKPMSTTSVGTYFTMK